MKTLIHAIGLILILTPLLALLAFVAYKLSAHFAFKLAIVIALMVFLMITGANILDL